MDEDEFVNNILNDRVENKLSSSKEILELNDKLLVDIYSNYMSYDKNKENLIKSRTRLNDYYFSNNNFNKGEFITYINSKYFYDLRIHKGGFIREIDGDILKLVNGSNIWSINMNNVLIFTKLNKEQKLKLIIINTFEEE
jgi:hypothetical protein